jgi:hypothetical protein
MPGPRSGILALGDANRLRTLIATAGFADAAIERVPFAFRFAGMDDYWAFLTDVAGAIAMVIARLERHERERVRTDIAELVAPYATGARLEFPAECIVATATAH